MREVINLPGVISIEYFESVQGVASGIATLDATGHLPIAQASPGSVETYKGEYASSVEIILAYPAASIADYAWSVADDAFWYWNGGLLVPAWVLQTITAAAYALLTTAAKAAVPYIVIG
jgi:hypothetical protein